MNILVIDLGSTRFKASVFDDSGALLALTSCPTPIKSGVADRCEILPEVFRRTIAELLHELNNKVPDVTRHVDAVTFATQTNSFILLDENNDPLTPIILWPDDRAKRNRQESASLSQLDNFQATTGVPSLSHQFMIAKLDWLQTHDPLLIKKTARLCLISDYLTLWFSGQHVTEAGTAGLTGLLDVHTNTWWPDACTAYRIPTAWLPRVAQAGTDLGPISCPVAKELGLPKTCRFIVGCLDQYAGAIGVGNVVPGGVSETTGTVLATVKCADAFQSDLPPGVFQGPAFSPGMYYQMVFGNTAGNWLEEYRNTLEPRPSFVALDSEAAEAPLGAGGLMLSRDDNPATRERLLIEHAQTHSRGHAVRAILETVSRALGDQVSLLFGDRAPSKILCAGGGARSRLWLQIKADRLNCTMVGMRCPEPTSLGAAMLAMHTLSDTPVQQIADKWIQPGEMISPDEMRHRVYATLNAQHSGN